MPMCVPATEKSHMERSMHKVSIKRLCILHGPSFSFLPPLFAFAAMPENQCFANSSTFVSEEEWMPKILTIQGSLLISVFTLIFMGATGLVGVFAKMVGPITITPLLLMLTLGVVPTLHEKMNLHWISVQWASSLKMSAYHCSTIPLRADPGKLQNPYLIAILAAWFICFLLTVTGLEPEEGEARTDKNHTMTVLTQSPWFQVPYPGVGSALAAVMGLGTGVTTYAENIALMHITRVASRSTMQVAGLLLILAGLFTKCAAVLASIPDAVVGGVLAMGLAMITGVAISNLQKVDLRLSRNLTIMGTAILLGTLIPYHFEKNRVNTGVKSLDDCLNMLLSIRMLIAGVIAFILDNTVPGATKEQRGFTLKGLDDNICAEDDGYAPSPLVRRYQLHIDINGLES
ncbi:putative permease [Ancylostoma duodenale]|uniref:Putative permease n=1 Tax=Ancylostoma duodenale TaxID=51022 RepID=A0A0C2DYE1_9BILA|nr:putative permease [Ancylostoma duodenale]